VSAHPTLYSLQLYVTHTHVGARILGLLRLHTSHRPLDAASLDPQQWPTHRYGYDLNHGLHGFGPVLTRFWRRAGLFPQRVTSPLT
jgi:hypothetical protein